MSLASSLALVFGSKKQPVKAGMAFWDANDGKEIEGTMQAFQYFPEKLSDSRSADYVSKTVPGGSHPIYTFVSGGERSISFDAIFTNENPTDVLTGLKNPYSVDIPSALRWVRQATYPTIGSDGTTKAPPLVVLYLPKSGIGLTEDKRSSGLTAAASAFFGPMTTNQVIGIMTSANIVYEAFHRDGTPRIATVSIEIKEVVQTKPNWRFVSGLESKDVDYVQSKYKRPLI